MLPAIKTILYATDFSDRSDAAFPVACSLARDLGARLIVFHAVPPPPVYTPEAVIPALPLDADLGPMSERLERIHSPYPGVRLERRVVEGYPAEEIVREARDRPLRPDLAGHARR
jgi:nucleotide-binding universal stress UspA family protein